MQILDLEHGLLNSSSPCRQGLLRAFLDTEELIICHKTAAGLLLDKNLLQCTPSLRGIILVCSDVDSLVWDNVEHQLTSCSVLLDVPSTQARLKIRVYIECSLSDCALCAFLDTLPYLDASALCGTLCMFILT